MAIDLRNWPYTHHRETEAEAAQKEREQGKRHPYHPPKPGYNWAPAAPAGGA